MTTVRQGTARDRSRAGHRVVLKLGGELIETPQGMTAAGKAIAALQGAVQLVVVHGGGKDIDAALTRAGIPKRQVDGLRITDAGTLDVVVGVLAGLLNTRLVAAVCAAGGKAVGVTGADAALLRVEKAKPHAAVNGSVVDLGRVGTPVNGARPRVVLDLWRLGYVPVVATIGSGEDGDLYNVNADTFAASLAGAISARRLIIAGGTAGVLDQHGHTIPALDALDIERLVMSGTATAGMIAKLSACRDAIARGVDEVIIADGHDIAEISKLVRRGRGAAARSCTIIAPPSPRGARTGSNSSTPTCESFSKDSDCR